MCVCEVVTCTIVIRSVLWVERLCHKNYLYITTKWYLVPYSPKGGGAVQWQRGKDEGQCWKVDVRNIMSAVREIAQAGRLMYMQIKVRTFLGMGARNNAHTHRNVCTTYTVCGCMDNGAYLNQSLLWDHFWIVFQFEFLLSLILNLFNPVIDLDFIWPTSVLPLPVYVSCLPLLLTFDYDFVEQFYT